MTNTMDGSGAQKPLNVKDNAAQLDKTIVGKTTTAMRTLTCVAQMRLLTVYMRMLASHLNSAANTTKLYTMYTAQSPTNARTNVTVVKLDLKLANARAELSELTRPATTLMAKNAAMMCGVMELNFVYLINKPVVKKTETPM